MGEKAKVKETVRLYSKVWQLPTFQRIILNLVLCAVGLSIILAFMRNIPFSVVGYRGSLLTYLVIYVTSMLIGTILMYAVVRKKDSPLDARRTAGSAQFGVIFWVVLGVIGGLLDLVLVIDFFEIRFLLLGLGVAYVFFAFLLTGLSDHHPVRNFIAAMIPAILWFALIAGFHDFPPIANLPLSSWLSFLITLTVYTAAVHIIFRAVSKPFERDLGLNGPELLRAFGYDYLMDNSEPFEKLITQIAEIQDIPLDVMVFKNDAGLAAVGVVLYVHPGPFRNLGSSGLPSTIMKYVTDKYNVPAFVMHGTCTHHQNLTNKMDFEPVLREIDQLIANTQVHETMSGPHWVEEGKFKVWTIIAGDSALAVSTSAPEFTDDIALEVSRTAVEKTVHEIPILSHLATVDAHNCIDDDAVSVMPGDEDAAAYIQAISSAVGKTVDMPHTEVSMGIGQLFPEFISAKEGMGPGGITALVLESSGKKSVFVTLDGNNVEPGYREKVIDRLTSEGFDAVEILTSDTHVVNAISLSSKGYPPIGCCEPERMLDAISEVAEIAGQSMNPVSVGLGFGEVRGLRTFGEKGFDTLTQDIAEAAGIAKRVGAATASIAFLISLIAIFFL
ncbi:MAG: DUF2070 family protein [Candidatus Thorarchaeota archaeon]